MTTKRITKNFLKIAAYFLGGILVLLIAFHFWFINHAEQLIEELVESRSNGKLKLEVRKFKFNWFSNKIELRNAVFYSTDTVTASTAYRFSVKTIRIQVKEILPLIFEKRILFDSLHLIEPDIIVTKLRSAKDTSAAGDTSMSIPQEMGKVYNSIQDALKVLQVTRFQVENGKFTLINKISPDEMPISITNIYMHLDNLQVDTNSSSTREKILFSDNVELNTHNQNIFFPDRRHRLSFSNFHINVLNHVAEFDSCTITASKGDSANASFSIFFDKLKMTNINFDTLYHNEVIKADSVYCINPRFQLNVDLAKRTGEAKPPPKLDELVQQLTGDMQLAFVSVQNGSFDINTTREGRPSSFTSDHNNFELQGLRAQKDAPRPLIVEKFVMAIHNYENFLRDSTYVMQFDSILINNDRISLSNFAYQELENNKPVNKVAMTQFELQGLSWDNLVFDQQLKAQNVTLYRPVINYDFTRSKEKRKNIFETLAAIGTILQLDNLNIVDGQVNLLFKNNTRLQLENADISVLGQQLVDSKKPNSIRRSVTELNFKKGFFKMGDLTADLADIRFNGITNHLEAGNIMIKKKNDVDINAADVAIESMIIDDDLQQVNINDINWGKADIRLSSFLQKNKKASGSFILKQVNGNNTSIIIDSSSTKISVFLHTLSADEISATGGKFQLTGLAANGSDLKVTDSLSFLNIQNLKITDRQPSSFANILYKNNGVHDSVYVNIPSMTLAPDINALINGKIYADAVNILKPVIRIHLYQAGESHSEKKNTLPDAIIDKLIVQQPQLYFISTTEKGTSALEWKRKEDNNYFEMDNVRMNNGDPTSFSADQLRFSISNFLYTNPKGRSFDAGNGKITAKIRNLKMQQTEINTWDWQGTVENLNAANFVLDSIGKKAGNLTITTAQLNDLSISSSLLLHLRELVKQNTTFNLKEITGSYHNIHDQFNWYNASYDKKTKYFSADSFLYRPTKDRETYISFQPYQSDYTTITTGAVNLGPFDIYRYINDTLFDLGTINVNDGRMTGFRDKRKTLQPGITKLLPVNSLKKISAHLLIDTIALNNARVEYEELNDKTNASGKIIVAKLNGSISHVRNYDLSPADSLHILATGLLQNSILTRLDMKQSYADTSAGFSMKVKMGPADITVLNPVLVPLASVELKSGQLDTLIMLVTGNDDIAYGKMKMLYHDLKIKLFKIREGKKSSSPAILSFFGNLIVKNSNKEKTNAVFFRRWKNRSAVNYLLKITMSGITSSIRFKKNRKELRRYKKEIKEINLLPAGLE